MQAEIESWEHVWEGCRVWWERAGIWQETVGWVLGESGEGERWMREGKQKKKNGLKEQE